MKFYMLDGNEKILCAVPSKDIISLYQNLNYHQADTIEGSLVLSEKYTSILSNVRYFAISDRESNHNFYLYRKTLVQVQNHEIAINGQGAFWDEMQGAYIKDRRPNQVTPADTIKLILSYSRWNVDYVDQMLEEESLRRDMNFYYVSLLDALNTVYQTWQVDIEPYINIEGHQITRRYVKLYQQQGGNNGRRFVYGDNALTVTQQANEGSIFTALVGRGAGVEETDADGNLTGGYSRKINFADVEWSKANGDPCDKPKGQEYVEWKESTEIYGYSDGKPRIGIVDFDNEKDPAQLLKETWAQLQQVGVPLVQFQATVGDVGYLNLGETVTIVRYDLDIKYQTRVTGIKWNRCDEAKSQITIGVKAIQSTADKIAGLQQSVAQANVNADEAKSTANHAIIDGTGAVVNYGPNEPTNPKEGNIWYDVQPDGTVVLKQYQNGQWVILIDDTTGQQIKNKVEAQQKELDKAVQDANAASAKADGLVAQVGDANTNAQKALTTAQQNQADLTQAKNQLSNIQSDLTSEKSTLSSAISDISQTKQRLSDLTTQAQTQGQTIVNIQKTQSGLTADIADVKGNVSSLQATANGLQAAVKDNQGSISKLQETASGLESDVADNKNNISAIKQTATSMSSTISNITDRNRTNYLAGTSSQPVTQISNGNGNIIVSNDRYLGSMGLKPGETITFSAYIENAPSDAKVVLQFYQSNSGTWGWINNVSGNVISKGQSGYSSVTTTIPNNAGSLIPVIYCKTSNLQITYSQAEIVIGNTRLPWTACQRDLATSQDISSINQTIDSIKTTVSSNSGNISQLEQTAQSLQSSIKDNQGSISKLQQTAGSLDSQIGNTNNDISSLKQRADSMESNISDNKNDISDLRQTANSLQSNIQSKADISQIAQLSNAIQSVVQSVGSFFPNGNFADSNIQAYWSPWDITKDYTNINYDAATYNGSFGNLLLHAAGGGYTKAISTEYIPVQPNKSVTVSLASRGDWYNSNGKPQTLQCYVHFYDSKKNATENGHFDLNCSNNQQWYDNSVTYDCNSNECYIRIEIVLQGNQENWAHITNVKVSSDGGESISSKISQMSDDINLRVQKGDLLSQINIQAGSTLIQSKKLFLDASSVVFSGNAFIPSAAITDLSADKITAGTLNAGNVNIINLDVNKLVGNTTEFVRSGWTNAYGSHVQIDGGGMTVKYGDWSTTFNTGGVSFNKGNEQLGGFTSLGMAGKPDWFEGTTMYAGGNAEYLAFSANDYNNTTQSQIPIKAIWLRNEFKGAGGFQAGWTFCDNVWANQVGMNSIQYDDWNIHFEKVTGNDGFSALTLVSGSGNGFYWGSDGSFGYVTNHGGLHNVRGSQIVYDINQNGGTCERWSGIN